MVLPAADCGRGLLSPHGVTLHHCTIVILLCTLCLNNTLELWMLAFHSASA